MAQVALLAGSFLVAFGPMLSIFALIVYHKAQLVILVTTAAFFYLLAATVAATVWFLLDAIMSGGGDGNSSSSSGAAAIIPGVFFQFLFRCAFTGLYHRVEQVIQTSLKKQHEQETAAADSNNNNNNNNNSNTSLHHGEPPRPPPGAAAAVASNNNNNNTYAEAAKLRLQLNDASAAIASAVGFGGMNCVLLYGTLWASETGNLGVLYESSCPNVPSLAVSAILANFFFVLQVFWMLLTFFGMRRRQLYHRGQSDESTDAGVVSGFWGNSRHGGNWALLTTLLTHFTASLLTLTNALHNGCVISVPAVGGVVLVTAYLFWAGCGRNYMPPATATETQILNSRHWD